MNNQDLDRSFETGRLYCDRGDYDLAIQNLTEASAGYLNAKEFSQYLKCLNLLLRIYAEREQNDEITATKERIQDLVLQEGFALTAKTFYTLATCAGYKSQTESALEYLQKSLALALQSDDKEDLCRALLGLATIYSHPAMGKMDAALKELGNLEVMLQVYDYPEIKIASLQLRGIVLSQLKKYDESFVFLWRAYDSVRETRNIIAGTYILIQLCDVYYETGNAEIARAYLNMAQRSIDTKNHARLARVAKFYADKIGLGAEANYDLILDKENHIVTERKLGKIDFKNQFILLELLYLFVKNPGTVYSKEYLMENVWKQAYDPAVHDNKIYVTIKRLRQLIEPDYEKPKYLFRAKNGYYINKTARIQIG